MASDTSQEHAPKVFLSYSWTSPTHEDKVLEFAKRLISHGVHVLLDKWDLKEGHDKYKFMEQAVVDPDVCKVLLICDKRYQVKADAREGGVGDETMIISPKLYGQAKQDKFIPVVFEKDTDNKPYLPAYIASRIYIDLSDETRYETEYEKLLRNIHDVPENQKPALGKKPEWISEAKTDFAPLYAIQRQIKGAVDNKRKREILCRQFGDQFSSMVFEHFTLAGIAVTGTLLETKISEMKAARDVFTDFLEVLLNEDIAIADEITAFFEKLFNTTHSINPHSRSLSDNTFEHFKFFIWESFLCAIALLLHHERYREIHDILCHTYFLKESPGSSSVKERSYVRFREYFRTLEEECNKPDEKGTRLLTVSGKILSERERKPLLTKESMSTADVVLYQMSYLLAATDESNYWFPTSYVYKSHAPIWRRLKSRKYCDKILPLFGLNTIEELKKLLSEHPDPNTPQRQFRYSQAWGSPQPFLYELTIDEIGSLY